MVRDISHLAYVFCFLAFPLLLVAPFQSPLHPRARLTTVRITGSIMPPTLNAWCSSLSLNQAPEHNNAHWRIIPMPSSMPHGLSFGARISHLHLNSHFQDLSSVSESLSLELPGCPPGLHRAQALGFLRCSVVFSHCVVYR